MRWEALKTLMEEHRLTADKYTILQPLFASPLYAAGDFAFRIKASLSTKKADVLKDDERIKFIKKVVQRFNKLVILCIVIWFYQTLQKLSNLTVKQATLGTILLIWGSFLIPHAQDFYSESLWSYFSLLALWLLSGFWRKTRKSINLIEMLVCILTIALSIPLNPSFMVVFIGLLLLTFSYRIFYSDRAHSMRVQTIFMRPDTVAITIALMVGGFFCLLENYIRRGQLADFGYASEGFTTPIIHGFLGQLISPTRGIIFFIPAFFWGVAFLSIHLKTRRDIFLNLTMLYSLLLLLTYSKWHTWHGAWYWGPRFLLPLSVIGILYLVLYFKERWNTSHPVIRVLLVASGLGSWMIYKIGVTINQKYLITCLEQSQNSEHCFWNFQLLPYHAFMNKQDLITLWFHRSTVVEILGIILIVLLIKVCETPNGNQSV